PQQISLVYHYFFFTLQNSALFLAPLVIYSAVRFRLRDVAIIAGSLLFAAVGTIQLLAAHFPMPYNPAPACCDLLRGSVFTTFGLGPPSIIDGLDPRYGYPFAITDAGRAALTIAAGILAVLLLATLAIKRRKDPAFLLCVGYVVGHTAALCASV